MAFFAGLSLLACDPKATPPAPSASASAASAPNDDAALARAKGAAQKLGGTLKTRLTTAMREGGAPKAIDVCSNEAPSIARSAQKESGVKLGRSSTKLRNPADAPPPWVKAWLDAHEGKKANKVKGIHTVVDTPDGRVARFLKPIELEGPCLACHGDPATLAPEIKAVLAAKYPNDQATGYQVGDLRGALWAEAPVPR
jgi:hypothetical protein